MIISLTNMGLLDGKNSKKNNSSYFKKKILYFSKFEKSMAFKKWTKINVQKLDTQKVLTEKKFCLDKFFLSSQIKPFFIFFITKKT